MSERAGYELPLLVTQHAVWRAAERFPGFDPLFIEVEIREAFRASRVSALKPPGVLNPQDPNALYAWTADGLRVYILKVNRYDEARSFVVTTTIRADLSGAKTYRRDRLRIERPEPPRPNYWGRR